MKKLIICILLLVGISNLKVVAQRYLPGQKGVQLAGGVVDLRSDSYHVGVAYSVYNKSRNRWVIGTEFLNRNTTYSNEKIPVSQLTAEAGYYLNFLSDRKDIFFLSLGMSALGGYETVNWNNKKLSDGAIIEDKDHFVLGGALTIELEAFLSDRVALLMNIRERCLFGGDTNKFHNQIGFGIKYFFN